MKQTFIIRTYGGGKKDFYRMDVKRVETCLKYIKKWAEQAKDRRMEYLYRDLLADDAHYTIVPTPDGYTELEPVASGLVADLFK